MHFRINLSSKWLKNIGRKWKWKNKQLFIEKIYWRRKGKKFHPLDVLKSKRTSQRRPFWMERDWLSLFFRVPGTSLCPAVHLTPYRTISYKSDETVQNTISYIPPRIQMVYADIIWRPFIWLINLRGLLCTYCKQIRTKIYHYGETFSMTR